MSMLSENPHPPYYPSPSPARSLPSCAKHATPAPYPSTDHCSLLTAHWTYTFSDKERDVETGLSYFGSRYYSSDLSIWLSVDPMSDKYASLSPYNYCANNPVKLVDPKGEDIIPDKSFIGTTYEKVHNYLLNNNRSYSKACESFESEKVFNLYLNCNKSAIPEGYKGFTKYSSHFKPVGDPGIYPGVQQVPMDAVSTESFHPDMSKGDISLWHFYIVIHEMGHTGEALNYKAANNMEDHGGFMILINSQINMWDDLNNALNLGLSSTQITELSMYGAEGSSDFKRYINDMSIKNGTTREKEIENYRQRIQELFEQNSKIEIPDLDQ